MSKKRVTASFAALLIISLMIALQAANMPAWFTQAHAHSSADTSIFLPLILKNHPYRSIFGVSLNKISNDGGLNQFANAGNDWLRTEMPWAAIEPTPGQRSWTAVANKEAELINAEQAGMQPILIIGSTPQWALKAGYTCGAINQEALDDFGEFIYDAVLRYSQPPYSIKYWELWNEPDVVDYLGCWGDETDPYYGGRYYAQMLQAAYPAIKAADPQAQVLTGGLLLDCDPINPPQDPNQPGQPKNCTASKFFEGILLGGGGAYFDVVNFHAYDYYSNNLGQYSNSNWHSRSDTTGPVQKAKAAYLQQVLNAYGVTGKVMVNTEVALLCDSCTNDANFEATKAYYLAQTYASAMSLGLKAEVWYNALGWRNSGLLNGNLTPKPAFHAFAFGRQMLGNATYTRDLTTLELGHTSLRGFELMHNGKRLWLLWKVDAGSLQVQLPAIPEKVWDVYGNELVVPTQTLTIDMAPQYIMLP